MTFLNPILAAAGLAAIAIPILIHLFMRRRRRPIRWGAMKFLLEAYRKHRRRLTLEQWLLLAARCLLIALIALAVGRLALAGAAADSGPRTLYLMVDNSLTSQLREGDASALERHVAQAGRLLDALDAMRGDRAGLILMGAPAEGAIVPATSELSRVRRVLEGVAATDAPMDLEGALAQLEGLLRAEGDGRDTRVVLLSDWRAGSVDAAGSIGEGPHLAGARALLQPPATDPAENVALIALEPARSVLLAAGEGPGAVGGTSQVRVTLQRFGQERGEQSRAVRLLLERGGELVPLGRTDVRFEAGAARAGATAPIVLRDATPGEGVIRAEIEGDALPADDARRRALDVRRTLRVGIVSRSPTARSARAIDQFDAADWLTLALEPLGAAPARREIEARRLLPAAVDPPRLAALDAVLVPSPDAIGEDAAEALAAFTRRGGLVVLLPDARAEAQSALARLLQRLDMPWQVAMEPTEPRAGLRPSPEMPEGSLLALLGGELEELARPVLVDRLLEVQAPAQDIQLALEGGAPLVLAARPPAGGLIVLFSAALDLDWTTLPAKPLMVPLVQEIVRQGVGRASSRPHALAGTRPEAPASAAELHPMTPAGDVLALGDDGRTLHPIRRAGVWQGVDSRGARVGAVVVNPDTGASSTDPQQAEQIEALLAPRFDQIRWLADRDDTDQTARRDRDALAGMGLGPLLFAAALAVAVLELVLARFASHAGEQKPAPEGAP